MAKGGMSASGLLVDVLLTVVQVTMKNNYEHEDHEDHGDQSQKNPVSGSAMLTGKFLRIQKVFATSSLFAEEFPDILENVRILYKISR